MASEDLHPLLESINKTLVSLREDVQKLTGEVEKVHTAIREVAETIRDAIQESIQAQAELKLMEHQMEVTAVKPQIEAERNQIKREQEELDERLEHIAERYQEKHDELDEVARERIRDLGSHIFEIDEDEFEEHIEQPFADQVTTAWQFLQSHNDEVREERQTRVRETTSEAVQTIHDFVDRQESLVHKVREHHLPATDLSMSGDQPARLQVPYYIVEYEVDGKTARETVVPSRLSMDDDAEWCTVSLSPIQGTPELMQDVSGPADPTRLGTVSKDEFTEVIKPYGEPSLLGLSYKDVAAETFPDGGNVPVRGSGGDR